MTNNDANSTPDTPHGDVRLDVWLWSARFFKTRSLAKKAIEQGKIRLNGGPVRASTHVRLGNSLSIERGEEKFGVVVAGMELRRGSATVARRMYAETEESRLERERAAEQRRMMRDGYQKPATKPDKRARRLIKALGDIDMT
ncbi:MAG TPA: RNA-binding S4 domain-containing protein [Rudaea sp.]|jgi:ribosome-associated heat shock protein Hsp15|nr:RNA-binding S4 domain-containing protein [Rudaea sp.]